MMWPSVISVKNLVLFSETVDLRSTTITVMPIEIRTTSDKINNVIIETYYVLYLNVFLHIKFYEASGWTHELFYTLQSPKKASFS